MALACALVIAGLPSASGLPVSWPLQVIAEALRFRRMSPERTLAALRHLAEEFTPHDDLINPPRITDRPSVLAWSAWVNKADRDRLSVPQPDLVAFEQEAWNYWEKRLLGQALMPELPRLGTIVTQVLGSGPGVYITIPVEEMPAERWTFAFVAAFVVAHPWNPTDSSFAYPVWLPLWMGLVALQHLNFDQYTLSRFHEHLRQFDKSLASRQFLPLGTISDERRPAGMLICRDRCPSMYWQPALNQALLVCDVTTASALMRTMQTAAKSGSSERSAPAPNRFVEALGLSFVAFDFSGVGSSVSAPEITAPMDIASSSAAPRSLFPNSELSLYDFFAPDPKAPIPVLIDDIKRSPGLDPRYTMTAINSPVELFTAVSAMLRQKPGQKA